jgi:predicted alpha-1,2-mannosidase
VNDLGNFGIMPTVTKSTDKLESLPFKSTPFWWSAFNKSTENAAPGSYSVQLSNPRIDVDLLAISTFAGIHKYRWNALSERDAVPTVVIDMCHAAQHGAGEDADCLNSTITIDETNTKFTGSLYFKGGLSHQLWVYISGEVEVHGADGSSSSITDTSISDWQTCTDADPSAGTSTCSTAKESTSTSGVLFSVVKFPQAAGRAVQLGRGLEVSVKVAISFISPELATQNLQDATRDTSDYAKLAARTKATWCALLSEVEVETLPGVYPDSGTGVDDLSVVLHSAHYRSFMSPTSYTESGGMYKGMDKLLHNATEERLAKYGSDAGIANTFYSDFSLWDTIRTQHPWMLLRNERHALDFARSLADMTVQQNAFPRWPLASTESGCMIGESGAAVLVECILAGMGHLIDVASVQPIFLGQSTEPWPLNGRTDVDHYMSAGYVSQDASGDATSETLSYAFDDYLLAKMSEYTGDLPSAQAAMQRSKNYQHVWSPESALFCPKYENGTMQCPASGKAPWSWTVFREGDAYHWSWFVPHDVEGLMALYPSSDAYNAALEAFFAQHVPVMDKIGNELPNPYYWAGNEHDFLAVYMFNFGGDCTRSQYWSRQLVPLHFSNTPHGNPGNEDYGAMASWVMFASLGVFPQAGTSKFLIGSPSVVSASLDLVHLYGPNSKLEIVAYNNTLQNMFVQKLLVNGQEHNQPWIDRSVLAARGGCKLEFFMSDVGQSGLCPSSHSRL